MKNLLFLLMAATISTACSENSKEQTQDYTSIVITATFDHDFEITEFVSGYYDADGVCHKIGEHGTIAAQANHKVSTPEFIVPDTCPADTIYLFCSTISLFDSQNKDACRCEYPFLLNKKRKNVLDISLPNIITKGWFELSKSDTRYPH